MRWTTHTMPEPGCQVRHAGENLRVHCHDLQVAREGDPLHDQDTVGRKSWHAVQVIVLGDVRPCRARVHHCPNEMTSYVRSVVGANSWI